MRSRTGFGAVGVVIIGLAAGLLTGCYENVEPQQPQAKAPDKPGPITSMQNQGGGSALAGAKRSATNTVNKAQQRDKQMSDEIDRMNGTTPSTPEPSENPE